MSDRRLPPADASRNDSAARSDSTAQHTVPTAGSRDEAEAARPGSRLKPGDVVMVRDDRWRVLHVAPYDECTVVELVGIANANRDTIARFILPFEAAEPVAAPVATPRRVRPAVLRVVARRTLSQAAPAWTALRAAAGARVTLLPYQLEPALAMTRGLSCRFLLADEVGLGKTIQAGLLTAELLARDPDARILIVTPAGLREQWREELRERFDIGAELLDAAALAHATAVLPAGLNPWLVPRVVLTSIDFVKRPDVIRALEPIVWDLVAFDEAHGLAGRSDRAAAADLLARRGRRVLAITATPHSGDPQAYQRLRALGSVGPDDPILTFRRSREDAGLTNRRAVRLLRIRLTPEERLLHRALESYARLVWREPPSASAPAARLAMMVLARRAGSSPASLARSVERRLAFLDTRDDRAGSQLTLPLGDGTLPDDEEPGAELAAPGLTDAVAERRWLERIHTLAHAAMFRESKIDALERLLRRASQPVLVFTEYRDTLVRLANVLAGRLGVPSGTFAALHGGLSAAERGREGRRFTHGDAPLLLATDVASEGLNLHRRCRLIVNLEVPWTPVRLEQRIGRVDRLGQQRRVHAIGLVGRDTAEESVVVALRARAATADREAPFVGASLRAEAQAEAARLQVCRALQQQAPAEGRVRERGRRLQTHPTRDTHEYEGHVGPTPRARIGDRPVISTLGRNRSHTYAAIRLTFVDASGFDVWDTVVGAECAADAESFRRATASVLAAPELAAFHDAVLRRLQDELRAATAPLIAREEGMLRTLQARGGRLAAPLVQPSLFDRRALRSADAQQRIAAEAAAAAARRIGTLRRAMDPVTGAHYLLFAVAV